MVWHLILEGNRTLWDLGSGSGLPSHKAFESKTNACHSSGWWKVRAALFGEEHQVLQSSLDSGLSHTLPYRFQRAYRSTYWFWQDHNVRTCNAQGLQELSKVEDHLRSTFKGTGKGTNYWLEETLREWSIGKSSARAYRWCYTRHQSSIECRCSNYHAREMGWYQ